MAQWLKYIHDPPTGATVKNIKRSMRIPSLHQSVMKGRRLRFHESRWSCMDKLGVWILVSVHTVLCSLHYTIIRRDLTPSIPTVIIMVATWNPVCYNPGASIKVATAFIQDDDRLTRNSRTELLNKERLNDLYKCWNDLYHSYYWCRRRSVQFRTKHYTEMI